MNAVIYARYSSDNQREESIEGQLRECRAYAEKNKINIVSIYTDRAFSAKTDNRPEFQQMIRDSANKNFDAVIVWKLDRFARNRLDSAQYKYILKKNGVKVISATENISDGAEGILLETLLEGIAEYYSVELAEKVIRGMTENALKCKFNGGVLPMGFCIENGYFQPDKETAPVVNEIFLKYASGESIQSIVDDMCSRGIVNSLGNPLNVNSVGRILRNRRYIGEYVYRDIVIPNGIPAIVSADLFDTVQEMLKVNHRSIAKHKANEEYLLTTKLFCGKCKNIMFGESGTSQMGNTYRYYKCSSVKKHLGCDKKSVKKDWIENLVVEDIKAIIDNDEMIDYISDSIMEILGTENPLLPLYRSQIADAERGINNLIKAIEMGIITDSTKSRLEELEEQKKKLALEIAKLEAEKPCISKQMIIDFMISFRKLNIKKLDHRRKLINCFVNSIYLYDDRIVILYNYKEYKVTLKLEEVESALESSNTLSLAAPK